MLGKDFTSKLKYIFYKRIIGVEPAVLDRGVLGPPR